MSKMQVIAFVTLIAMVVSELAPLKCGDIVLKNKLRFEEEVLKDDLAAPFDLVMDWKTNTLFFTFNPAQDSVEATGYLNLDTKEFGVIPGLTAGTGVAVDNKNHVVYVNGLEGIHTFNVTTKELTYIDGKDQFTWQMFFKDRLYYTMLGVEGVHVYDSGKSEKVKAIDDAKLSAHVVGVDNDDNIWFSNADGLFCYDKVGDKIIRAGDQYVISFFTDILGELLFLAPDGIFKINKDKSIDPIWEKSAIFGATVDSYNNLIYSDEHRIVRLNNVECPPGTNE